jgi:ceramide glucosyltransferase
LGGGALIFRTLTALQQQARLTRNWSHLRYWWLVPIKDVLDFILWSAAFLGNQVEWRGERFRVSLGGKLTRINQP